MGVLVSRPVYSLVALAMICAVSQSAEAQGKFSGGFGTCGPGGCPGTAATASYPAANYLANSYSANSYSANGYPTGGYTITSYAAQPASGYSQAYASASPSMSYGSSGVPSPYPSYSSAYPIYGTSHGMSLPLATNAVSEHSMSYATYAPGSSVVYSFSPYSGVTQAYAGGCSASTAIISSCH